MTWKISKKAMKQSRIDCRFHIRHKRSARFVSIRKTDTDVQQAARIVQYPLSSDIELFRKRSFNVYSDTAATLQSSVICCKQTTIIFGIDQLSSFIYSSFLFHRFFGDSLSILQNPRAGIIQEFL